MVCRSCRCHWRCLLQGSIIFRVFEILSNFYGALGLALASEILARKCKTPVTTFLVCALIPLVPGGGMYRTMLAAIRGDAQKH